MQNALWLSGSLLVLWWLSGGCLVALWWYGSWMAWLLEGIALGWHGSWMAWLLNGVALVWRGSLLAWLSGGFSCSLTLWLSHCFTLWLSATVFSQCFDNVFTLFLHCFDIVLTLLGIVLTLFWHCFDSLTLRLFYALWLFDSPVLCWFSGGLLVAAWLLSDGMALEWRGSCMAWLSVGVAFWWF